MRGVRKNRAEVGGGEKKSKREKGKGGFPLFRIPPPLHTPSLPLSTPFHVGYSSVEFCSVPYTRLNSPVPWPTFIVTIFVDSRRGI